MKGWTCTQQCCADFNQRAEQTCWVTLSAIRPRTILPALYTHVYLHNHQGVVLTCGLVRCR